MAPEDTMRSPKWGKQLTVLSSYETYERTTAMNDMAHDSKGAEAAHAPWR